MKILITGGGGLIGTAIAKEHLSHGDEVFIYDNHSNKFNDYSTNVGFDVSKDSLWLILNDYKFDIISHQAACVGVGESQYSIQKYVDNNIGFTGKLLQCILDSKNFPKKLLLGGSMGPYGEGQYLDVLDRKFYPNNRKELEDGYLSLPIKEEDNKNPQSIYAVTKLAQEEFFRVFSETYNIPTISLRYFSVYGTKFNPNNPYTGVLSIIAAMIINSDKVEMFEDGNQTRDLIHCDDVAKAHYKACNKVMNFPHTYTFEEYNIGTGCSYSLRYIAEKMISLLQPDKELVFNNQHRKGDIRHSKANILKAKSWLKWKPEIELDNSIVEYCQFIKENWDTFKVEDTNKKEKENLLKYNLIK